MKSTLYQKSVKKLLKAGDRGAIEAELKNITETLRGQMTDSRRDELTTAYLWLSNYLTPPDKPRLPAIGTDRRDQYASRQPHRRGAVGVPAPPLVSAIGRLCIKRQLPDGLY